MFSKETIELAKKLADTYKEFGESVRKDTNDLADCMMVSPLQIFFNRCVDADEQLVKGYLPNICFEHESAEFKHLEYCLGEVRCVTLVRKAKED